MDIDYSSVKLLNIRQLTVVNGNACYEITEPDPHSDSVHHVFTPHSTVFIALKHAGTIHIFNLKNDGYFPDEFKKYIHAINSQLETFFNETTSVHAVFDLHKVINDNPHRFAVINKGYRCNEMMDLTRAKTKIKELNAVLKPACPSFYLNLDYITAFPENSDASLYFDIYVNSYFCPKIILCLFTEVNETKKCVSSITFNRASDEEMSINSRTDGSYQGRKFNILLRAVAIIVSQLIMETTQQLTSTALNVISALIMIKWFNAISKRVNISNKTVSHDELYDRLTRYFKGNGNRMETYVVLNEANTANAARVFDETIARMNCGPLQGGMKRTRNQTKQMKQRKQRNQTKQMKQRNQKRQRKTKRTRKPH